MDAKEILAIIQRNFSIEEFAECEYDQEDMTRLGLGEVVEVDSYGGSGKGSTWYSVKHFRDHDVYIRTDGYYTSYSGIDFEEGYGREVWPKEKTITVYN